MKRYCGLLFFILCRNRTEVLAVHSIKIAVIVVAHLYGGKGGGRIAADQLFGKRQLFLKNVLLGGDLHFFRE